MGKRIMEILPYTNRWFQILPFVLARWEAIANDSRVFYSAIRNTRSNFPKPSNGKYYLVDAGYPQVKGHLGPYKGDRYHLPHFGGDEPTGYKEIFNHTHSLFRGVIERNFRVWKKESILHDMPSFPYEKQVKIVIATMVLHNYIRYAQRDVGFDESGNYMSEDVDDEFDDIANEGDGLGRQEMQLLRDTIAQSLMESSA